MDIAAIIPDAHIPYHDKQCFNTMLLALQDIKLKEIVVLGDFGDFYSVTSHGKHPTMVDTLIQEVEAVNDHLDLLDGLFPHVKKVFLAGNHEHRVERYLLNNAPALFGITSIEFLLQFNTRPNWTFVPYTKRQKYSVLGTSLIARHEPYSMSSAKASLRNCLSNLVYGHIHRIEEFNTVDIMGNTLVNYTPGWLGDDRYDKVFGYCAPKWQKGFSLVYAEEGSKEFSHEILRFRKDKSVICHGKRYKL